MDPSSLIVFVEGKTALLVLALRYFDWSSRRQILPFQAQLQSSQAQVDIDGDPKGLSGVTSMQALCPIGPALPHPQTQGNQRDTSHHPFTPRVGWLSMVFTRRFVRRHLPVGSLIHLCRDSGTLGSEPASPTLPFAALQGFRPWGICLESRKHSEGRSRISRQTRMGLLERSASADRQLPHPRRRQQ